MKVQGMGNYLNIWKVPVPAPWYRLDLKLKYFCRKIKWVWQRAKYGFCERDVWDFDITLSYYIAGATQVLKETTHGHPYGVTMEEWEDILSSISNSFYLGVNEDAWSNPYEEEYMNFKANRTSFSDEEKQKEIELTRKFIDQAHENRRHQRIRLQEGMGMLQKWYYDLWD